MHLVKLTVTLIVGALAAAPAVAAPVASTLQSRKLDNQNGTFWNRRATPPVPTNKAIIPPAKPQPKEIELEDTFQHIGAQLIKEVASKTNDVAGDGTTTGTVINASSLLRRSLSLARKEQGEASS
ncbi:hypothetical protein DL96DRAFT_1687028 [Flagelloscypha sp. PMI_526]|nr:hypothetical protein DL96DRAFT_1687028 [Flagelloscypha sp. PMI_526]